MGRISAVFKADGPETESRYSVSEWWLEPCTQGPGAHSHAEDDLFYVIEGTMSVLVGEEWVEAAKGSVCSCTWRRHTMILKTGEVFAPGFSISRCLVRLSLKCRHR